MPNMFCFWPQAIDTWYPKTFSALHMAATKLTLQTKSLLKITTKTVKTIPNSIPTKMIILPSPKWHTKTYKTKNSKSSKVNFLYQKVHHSNSNQTYQMHQMTITTPLLFSHSQATSHTVKCHHKNIPQVSQSITISTCSKWLIPSMVNKVTTIHHNTSIQNSSHIHQNIPAPKFA